MTVGDAEIILDFIVSSTWRASLHDIVSAIIQDNLVPKIVDGHVFEAVEFTTEVEEHLVGGACHRACGVNRISTLDMLIVTVELGEGLLEDWSPDRLIITDMSEEGLFGACLQWQEVIDKDGVRHTKSIDVHTIYTIRVE